MYTMNQACKSLNISYETLRFYCDEGLIPNVKRDRNNYRKFDERDLEWLKSLLCLKRCGMSIKDMKEYMRLCMQGFSSINKRKEILNEQKSKLLKEMEQIQSNIAFIDEKQHYFDEVLTGKIAYTSNLIDIG